MFISNNDRLGQFWRACHLEWRHVSGELSTHTLTSFSCDDPVIYLFYNGANVFFISSIKESNGPTDNYAAIAQVDIQRQEPESLRKWREEQKARLEALGEQRWPHWGNESYSGANALPTL